MKPLVTKRRRWNRTMWKMWISKNIREEKLMSQICRIDCFRSNVKYFPQDIEINEQKTESLSAPSRRTVFKSETGLAWQVGGSGTDAKTNRFRSQVADWPHAAQINATHWKWPYMGIYWYYVSHTGCHKFPTDNLLIRSCPNCLFCGVTDMTVFSERVHLQFDCTIPHTCACGTGFFWNNLSQSSYFWV